MITKLIIITIVIKKKLITLIFYAYIILRERET